MFFPNEKWTLNSVRLEHNHGLSQGKSRFYKCNRILKPRVKRSLELNEKAGIRMNKLFSTFVVEGGGHENLTFSEKDCKNYTIKIRKSQHNYFVKM